MSTLSQSTTNTTANVPLRANQPPTTSPPVSLSPQCHLDPACYVKGTHSLTIEQNAILHPRCRLYTDQGPITIKQGCILNERCILGIDRELNPPIVTADSNQDPVSSATDGGNAAARQAEAEIVLGARTYLHSSVKLQPPCRIGDSCVLESGVTLAPNCAVGAHSKICAGITLPPGTYVPDWTVVYGLHGQRRRQRQVDDVAEDARLDGLRRERAGVEMLLKVNATKSLGAASGSRSKRESVMLRSDSQKE